MNLHVCKRPNLHDIRSSTFIFHIVWICDIEEIVVHVEGGTGALEVGESRGIRSEGHVLTGGGGERKAAEERGGGSGMYWMESRIQPKKQCCDNSLFDHGHTPDTVSHRTKTIPHMPDTILYRPDTGHSSQAQYHFTQARPYSTLD